MKGFSFYSIQLLLLTIAVKQIVQKKNQTEPFLSTSNLLFLLEKIPFPITKSHESLSTSTSS